MSRTFKVRDKRNRGWFFLDNEYLNGYAKHFGAVGTAIYVSLCRHADGEQKCFPSQILIGKELDISDRTVRRYLDKFAKCHLIAIEKERKGGRWLNNVYYLLDKSEWISPEDIVSFGDHRTLTTPPEDNNDSNQRTQCPTKNTNRKNTNIRKKERSIKTTTNELKSIEQRKTSIRSLLKNGVKS